MPGRRLRTQRLPYAQSTVIEQLSRGDLLALGPVGGGNPKQLDQKIAGFPGMASFCLGHLLGLLGFQHADGGACSARQQAYHKQQDTGRRRLWRAINFPVL